MEEILEQLKDYFAQDDVTSAQELIDSLISDYKWKDIVGLLKTASKSLYREHLLKTKHMVLSIFNLSELIGVDCDIFNEIESIQRASNLREASDFIFENLIQIAKAQLNFGGSTLFFSVEKLQATRSVILIPDLIKARYRETILILAELDEQSSKFPNEWINAARLWRIGYGLRILKARNQGLLIHIKDYKEIRKQILNNLGLKTENINEEKSQLIRDNKGKYLQLSETLDAFILGYISSLGIRGKYEPYYKTMINHEDLDEF